jgi:F0F1-type ATP synthase membrane subunit c/vacuolar-type H+-ATPase subunit K
MVNEVIEMMAVPAVIVLFSIYALYKKLEIPFPRVLQNRTVLIVFMLMSCLAVYPAILAWMISQLDARLIPPFARLVRNAFALTVPFIAALMLAFTDKNKAALKENTSGGRLPVVYGLLEAQAMYPLIGIIMGITRARESADRFIETDQSGVLSHSITVLLACMSVGFVAMWIVITRRPASSMADKNQAAQPDPFPKILTLLALAEVPALAGLIYAVMRIGGFPAQP